MIATPSQIHASSRNTHLETSKGDRTLFLAAIAVVVGALLSGPVGVVATLVDPQPPWTDAATFIAHFRAWHQIPYWFGFVFIAAWVSLNARLISLALQGYQTRAFAALIATAVYGAIITSNYALQVAYVPAAVATSDPGVAYVTMVNPAAVSWALEMFGYAALGVSNGLAAGLFPGSSRRRQWIVGLMIANATVDLLSAVMAAIDLRWVMTLPGLVAYLLWNVLVIVTAALIAAEYRPR